MSNLHRKPVRQVADILASKAHSTSVVELVDTARSADEAAAALGVAVGAIVKTLLFVIASEQEETPVIALIAGDRTCDTDSLATILGIDGTASRPNANRVKALTGYSIGGVSPIGLPDDLTILMDASLARFDTIWSAAGHPHCVFASSFEELCTLTGATVTDALTGSRQAADRQLTGSTYCPRGTGAIGLPDKPPL